MELKVIILDSAIQLTPLVELIHNGIESYYVHPVFPSLT